MSPRTEFFNRLEAQLETGLHCSRRSPGAGDLAKGAVAGSVVIRARGAEDRMVEGVEHLPPELHVVSLAEGKVLGEIQICLVPARPVDGISADVPEGSGRVIGKGRGIKVLIQPVLLAALVDVKRLARYPVRIVVVDLRIGGIVISPSNR